MSHEPDLIRITSADTPTVITIEADNPEAVRIQQPPTVVAVTSADTGPGVVHLTDPATPAVIRLSCIVGPPGQLPPLRDATLAYNPDGTLATVDLAGGDTLTMSYGPDGLTSVDSSDTGGPVVTLGYTNGRLTSATY